MNLSASRGRIADTDFASETSNLARNQILQQAATAMVAQANASKGAVLTRSIANKLTERFVFWIVKSFKTF